MENFIVIVAAISLACIVVIFVGIGIIEKQKNEPKKGGCLNLIMTIAFIIGTLGFIIVSVSQCGGNSGFKDRMENPRRL